MLPFAILSISLVSCITPPDVPFGVANDPIVIEKKDAFGIVVRDVRPNPVCMKEIKEPACGYYVWLISDKEQYVGEAKATWLYGKPWSRLKAEAIYTPSESQAEVNSYFINTCKKQQNCNKNISRWRAKSDKLLKTKDGGNDKSTGRNVR
jgi:hypothetical protein